MFGVSVLALWYMSVSMIDFKTAHGKSIVGGSIHWTANCEDSAELKYFSKTSRVRWCLFVGVCLSDRQLELVSISGWSPLGTEDNAAALDDCLRCSINCITNHQLGICVQHGDQIKVESDCVLFHLIGTELELPLTWPYFLCRLGIRKHYKSILDNAFNLVGD